MCCRILVILIFAAGVVPAADTPEFAAADLDFFEKKIRPILIKHCYECHGEESLVAKKLRGGLRVDFRNGLLAGGESGPSIVPGKASESLLIEALKFESFEMPPAGKLPDAVIADFETWINRGAADPREGGIAKAADGVDLEEGRRHWAYRPLNVPENASIDALIQNRLDEEGLSGNEPASREVLIRRLYFDLTGLPPTVDQIDAFVTSESPTATEEVVDELLASPAFGERWGRHWLDVARYADSITLRGFILPEAWRYRDYVIDSFNQDRSFAKFVVEQLAGDLLSAESRDEEIRQRIATGFLALGNSNLEDQDKAKLRMDVVDEQLDTIGRAFLAQTNGCARCHDHKFDPIPTADYYALAGILRSTKTLNHSNVSQWIELPLPAGPDLQKRLDEHTAEVTRLQARIGALKAEIGPSQKTASSRNSIPVSSLPGVVVDDTQAEQSGDWVKSTYSKPYVADGYRHDSGRPKGACRILFRPDLSEEAEYEVRLAYSHSAGRCRNVPVRIVSIDEAKTVSVDQTKRPEVDGTFTSLGQFHFDKDATGYVSISNEGTTGVITVDAVQFIPIGQLKPDSGAIAKSDIADKTPAEKKVLVDQLATLTKEMGELQKQKPVQPKYLSIQEESKIEDTKIHIRGNVHNLGETAPRGFLQVASGSPSFELPGKQSGRKELGDWIVRANNPLTARVMVNRIWHWLFGSGIVRTTDNFGTTGETPSHPELLDYLARRFVEQNWSVKKLIGEIALSQTYQQSSASSDDGLSIDPDNRLLWRANRRRLDAECLLDAMLMISGQLDSATGGSTIRERTGNDYNYRHESNRRAVYWPVFRNSLPDIFDAFDFANPSFTKGKRDVSSVAPQALFMMNNPFVLIQAEETARRLVKMEADDDQRLKFAFRSILGRIPTAGELESTQEFLHDGDGNASKRWAQVVQVLLASVDFRYVY